MALSGRISRSLAAAIIGTLALLGSACSSPTQNDGAFIFGREVPEEEREPIRQGVDAMLEWLAAAGNVRPRSYHIEVHDDIGLLISRYAFYNPDDEPISTAQWFVSGGALAIGQEVYIYTGDEWRDYAEWQKTWIAAHELFHVVQYRFLYEDYLLTDQLPLDYPPNWIVEGMADYATALALDAAGIRPFEEELAAVTSQSMAYRNSLASLSGITGTHSRGDAAPYAVGFLAVHELVSEHGEVSLIDFWDLFGEDISWEVTFEEVFGTTPAEFALAFDETREAALADVTGGIAGVVQRTNAAPVPGASVSACEVQTLVCVGTFTDFNGAFELALEPGEYDVFFRVASREGVEIGALGPSGESVQVGSEVISGLVGTAEFDF